MEILRPNQTFRILFVIPDPNDSTTYYPQVQIKQTLTGTVLLSAGNLKLDVTGRYYYDWIVPGDTNGGGTQIDVTVTVYTDSGHTVLSQVYGRQNDVYNIFDLASLMRGGGGSSSSLDERDVARIIKKELALLIIPDHGNSLAATQRMVLTLLERFGEGFPVKTNDDVLEALSKLPQYGQSLDKILSQAARMTDSLNGNHGQALEGMQNLAGSIGKVMDILTSFTKWMRSVEQSLGEMPEKFGGRAEKFEQSISQMEKSMKAIGRALSGIQTVTVHTGLSMPGEDLPKENSC